MFKAIKDFLSFYFVTPKPKPEVAPPKDNKPTPSPKPTATKTTRGRPKSTKKPNGTTKNKTKK